MKTGFKDPIADRAKEKKEKSPWNFSAPKYDERTSCYINAGTYHGVGHKNPVGSVGGAKPSDAIPKRSVSTLGLYPGQTREIEQ